MPSSHWVFDCFRLTLDHACLWRGTEALPLTPKAFDVLHYLVTHPDRLVTKDELLDAVWAETAVSDAVVRIAISELRKVLRDTAHTPRFIATVHRRGYRFLAPVIAVSGVPSTTVAASPLLRPVHTPSPAVLVEREAVLHQLQGCLAHAAQGARQVVFVSGESGIGKTAVVEAFATQAVAQEGLWVAQGQCVEHYSAGEASLPVLEALEQLCRGPEGARLIALLRQQAPTWLVQMPWLLDAADRERLQYELQGVTRERMLRECAAVADALTAETLLLLILEDLHWSDYATLDLLTMLARRRTPARLLVVGTYRPVEVIVQGHPLRTVTQELRRQGYGTEIPLTLLSVEAVLAYLTARFPGHRFPPMLVPWLHQHTDGNPLFLVTLLAALVGRGVIVEREEGWTLVGGLEAMAGEVPEGLRLLLDQQLERLPAAEQQVVEVASAAGMTFAAAVVAAGLDATVAQTEAQCDALVRRQVLRPAGLETCPDGTVTTRYEFVHALYQQAAYERLGVGQRAHVHQRLGMQLERAYGSQVAEIAVELAVHFERSHDVPRAVRYWQQTAENAVRRWAQQEVLGAVRRALELLPLLPDTPERAQRELALQIMLGPALMDTKGYTAPDVVHAYTRALILCQQSGDSPQRFAVLRGLRRVYAGRAEMVQAQAMGEELLALAQRSHHTGYLLEAHLGVGTNWLLMGALENARTHLEAALALYNPAEHRAHTILYGFGPGVLSRATLSSVLWLAGYPDQARVCSQEAIALAQHALHPSSLHFALLWDTRVAQYCRDAQLTQAGAETTLALAREAGLGLAIATMLRGWALAMQGRGVEGIDQISQGMAAQQAIDGMLTQPHYAALLAEASLQTGQPEAGLPVVTEALAAVCTHGHRYYAAELSRLQGELVLQAAGGGRGSDAATPTRLSQSLQESAEACFQQALTIACRQQAKAWELRTAMSLSRLWQRQGKRAAARQLLAEIYGWFTEGFATVDLQEARALLTDLE